MINDLIDLYFHIKSTETLRDFCNWNFYELGELHLVEHSNVVHPHEGVTWRFKIWCGTQEEYKCVFILRNKISIHSHQAYSHSLNVPAAITDEERMELQSYLSEDEINIISEIYIEMQKITDRTEIHDVHIAIDALRSTEI